MSVVLTKTDSHLSLECNRSNTTIHSLWDLVHSQQCHLILFAEQRDRVDWVVDHLIPRNGFAIDSQYAILQPTSHLGIAGRANTGTFTCLENTNLVKTQHVAQASPGLVRVPGALRSRGAGRIRCRRDHLPIRHIRHRSLSLLESLLSS